MINEKVKAEMELNYGKIISENPLTIKDEECGMIYMGLPAQILLDEVIEDMKQSEFDSSDLSSLDPESWLLVTGSFDYADEFDMSEWTTMTVLEYQEMVEKLNNHSDEIEWYFGTNEYMQFSSGSALLDSLEVQPITNEHYDVLDKLFGGSFDGGSGAFDYIYELGDEDEDDEDEDGDYDFIKDHKKELDRLETFGWTITEHDKENYQFRYEHVNGDYAISGGSLLDDLTKYYKKNK